MNKVLITIGPLAIYWYSVLIIVALFIGIGIAERYSKKLFLPGTLINDLVLGLVIWSIIGARLYYVIFNFKEYSDNLIEILMIWKGGLAIYGAIIAGILYIANFCKKRSVSLIKVLDTCSLSLLLGQAIGRWGNFFNQEAYGAITTKKALQNLYLPNFIIKGMYIDGAYRTPTFLYESLWCLLGVIILFIIRKRKTYKKGKQISFYLLWYGIGRFYIERLRSDSLYIGNYKISVIVSIIAIIIGLIGLILSTFMNKTKQSITVANNNGRI
ncbi:MAG: prolipoprotein diacylglyceryl transferase [Bacilli bacterium]|nr:prolipoprotein diacylglyceryl transferase [Bacilli bacterium]